MGYRSKSKTYLNLPPKTNFERFKHAAENLFQINSTRTPMSLHHENMPI